MDFIIRNILSILYKKSLLTYAIAAMILAYSFGGESAFFLPPFALFALFGKIVLFRLVCLFFNNITYAFRKQKQFFS